MIHPFRRFALLAPLPTLCFLANPLLAQRDRITAPVERGRTVVLTGNRHFAAVSANDLGAVEPSFKMQSMTLRLKRSSAQQADMDQLLSDQREPSSPNYHKWLTPEQYGDRFGASQNDMAKIQAWLESEGLTIDIAARGRGWIQFSGTAAQVSSALHTEIHRYSVKGVTHYANATAPSIPAALSGIVSSIGGLHNFRPLPHLRKLGAEYNTASGTHRLVPDDIATIYHVQPLYSESIDGTGQNIAVVGQTTVNLSDIQAFRTKFNLGSQTVLRQVKNSNPGLSQDDLPEADLDIEWAGSMAKNATVTFVYATDVVTAAQYAIDQNVAPIISMSYGLCEPADLVDLPFFQEIAQQANAQGQTWLAASGDTGAADCDGLNDGIIAQAGKAVDAPGSIPEVTSVGGTQFNEGGGTYWAATNNGNSGSAMSYIPEIVWNTWDATNGISSGGGGASVFFPKPSWQTGPGVPNDGFRDVPDVSFSASNSHDVYWVQTGGSTAFYGGTSVPTPMFASMIALLNQYLVSTGAEKQAGLGNINPALYRIAQSNPGVFHDVVNGGNTVPCAANSQDCVNASFGYTAGPGFDLASGLGSVDVSNLVHQWSNVPAKQSAIVVSIDTNPVFQQQSRAGGGGWSPTLTLTEEAGVASTLTSVTADGKDLSAQITSLFGGSSIPAGGSIFGKISLTNVAVPKNVVFTFAGTDVGTGTPWSQSFTVPFKGPQVIESISAVTNAASFQQVYAPGMIMAVFGVEMGSTPLSAAAAPLPNFMGGISAFVNSVPAPLYYVSPTQLNIQIPYETRPGLAQLEIDTPYQTATSTFVVAAAGPGVFTFADGSITPQNSGSRGGTYSLYITGEGQVTPSVTTGQTPFPGTVPSPRQTASMTIGGVPVQTPFAFIGIPNWAVGVTQINFVVPANAPLGPQDVVVTIGGVSSQPVKFTVTN